MTWYAAAIVLGLGLFLWALYADLRTTRQERAGFMKEAGKEKKEAGRLASELQAQLALTKNLVSTVRTLRDEKEHAKAVVCEIHDDYRRQLADAQRERDAAQREACYATDERDRARADLAEVKRRASLVLRQWAEAVETGEWPLAAAESNARVPA